VKHVFIVCNLLRILVTQNFSDNKAFVVKKKFLSL